MTPPLQKNANTDHSPESKHPCDHDCYSVSEKMAAKGGKVTVPEVNFEASYHKCGSCLLSVIGIS